jgi:hypothetical protein
MNNEVSTLINIGFESWPGYWLNANETFFIALKSKKPGIIFAKPGTP